MFNRLFGLRTLAPDEAEDVAALKQAFADFLIAPSAEDIRRSLDGWSWMEVPNTPPIFVTAFGDMLFRRSNDLVMLDTLDGTLVPVAKSVSDLRQRLSDIELQDHIFSSVWVQAARRRGLALTPETCFDWRIAPALGGTISADNIETRLFVVKVHIAGQLHQQISSLAPGTKISKVTISD
ncbi:hypothetical protein [Brevundimonas sp. A19_0]|uniref:hypothetical protein n=1 Tax=Brevundimonas sp. A19_0 TaxID=2821087 RepID=UPI001ADA4FCA|nr:hypothetical protein [Brevundimonas sp. A19_0]MBO9501248.1 hypothetical protein [Brevundimonas sp. A19_0]